MAARRTEQELKLLELAREHQTELKVWKTRLDGLEKEMQTQTIPEENKEKGIGRESGPQKRKNRNERTNPILHGNSKVTLTDNS